MLDLIHDISKFCAKRYNKISLVDAHYKKIDQELNNMLNEFKKVLPVEYHQKLMQLEEECAYKRELSNSLLYKIGFREGVKAFTYTIFSKN